MKENNTILQKSKLFALQIINLYKTLCEDKKEFILSKQILRSGTSIGANIKESIFAQSKADFYSKLNIARKEAGETEYWIELLYISKYISKQEFNAIDTSCKELLKLLTAITKTQKL